MAIPARKIRKDYTAVTAKSITWYEQVKGARVSAGYGNEKPVNQRIFKRGLDDAKRT